MGLLDMFKPKTEEQNKYTQVGMKGRKITKNVNALTFYTGMINQYVTHDDIPDRALGNGDFYYTAESIMTNNGVKKPFVVVRLPEEMDRGWVSDLRLHIDDYIHAFRLKTGIEATVSVNLVEDLVHYNLNLDSIRSRGRWVSFARQYERVANQLEDRTLEDELKTDKHSEAVRRKVKSFLHIKMARDMYKSAFYKAAIFLELHSQSEDLYQANDALKEAERGLNTFCFQNDIKVKRIFMDAHNYYKNYGPTSSFNDSVLLRRKFTGNVYSDDTLSSLVVTEHGRVGDETGVYHGVDVRSREIVSFDLSKGSGAKNVLVTAATGEGKSRAMKTLLTFYAIDPKYQTVIFDYEGTEYAALGKVTDAVTVGIGSTRGAYVNTMVVTKPTGDYDNDISRLSKAKEMTTKVFDILFDQEYGMSNIERPIFSYVLSKIYEDAGINEEQPEHWHTRSADLTFYTIYEKLRQLMEERRDENFYNNFNPADVRDFYNVVAQYFAKGQIYNYWFQEPISIVDFLETKDVIFNFEMGGVSEESVNVQQLALRQLFASHLTSLKSMYNKEKGIRTVVVIEEMQRYLKQKDSSQIITTFVTGGRKNGLIVYLVTNSPEELIVSGDADSPYLEKNMTSILSNINILLIGALSRSAMESLIYKFDGLQNSEGYLYELADIKEKSKKDAPLKYCFYVKYNDQKTVVKFIVHPAFDKSPLYYAAPSEYNKTLMSAEETDQATLASQINLASQEDKETSNLTYGEKVERIWLDKGLDER